MFRWFLQDEPVCRRAIDRYGLLCVRVRGGTVPCYIRNYLTDLKKKIKRRTVARSGTIDQVTNLIDLERSEFLPLTGLLVML